MCGIVAIAGAREVTDRLIDGLSRLEYRGYDSAGIAVANGAVERRRAPGKLSALVDVLKDNPLSGTTGIAHTRWATHGKPTEANAHPHMSGRVAIVHNGIIENFQALRQRMQNAGRVFESDTDSEVIAQLLNHYLDEGTVPVDAFETMLGELTGAFAIAAVFAGEEGLLIGARQGSPLVLGYGDDEMYLGSDAIALAPFTRDVTYLEEGDWVVAYPQTATIRNRDGQLVNRPRVRSKVNAAMVELGDFDHFMRKEIHEQPEALSRTLSPYIDQAAGGLLENEDIAALFEDADRAVLIACGTAHYSTQVAKYWFESLAHLAVEVDIASEYRYRQPVLPRTGPAVFVSQSGETADTLAALKYCKARKTPTVGVVNVSESSIWRESAHLFPTHAGPEIGVASTKAFTAQLAALSVMALTAARARGQVPASAEQAYVDSLMALPRQLNEIIARENEIKAIAPRIANAENVFYLGRGVNYPLALEGALKLKEITYINAQGYAAGELKHGPIALIEAGLPVVVIAPYDDLFEKTISNVQEVRARGAEIILISDAKGLAMAEGDYEAGIEVPEAGLLASPILCAAALQMLAYHVALTKGTDVDKPRNLAKSVTVE